LALGFICPARYRGVVIGVGVAWKVSARSVLREEAPPLNKFVAEPLETVHMLMFKALRGRGGSVTEIVKRKITEVERPRRWR